MKLEFHPEAELELIEAVVYYEHAVPGLGERFETEVRRATDLHLDAPEIGAPIDMQIRQFVLISFPYNLIYVTSTDSVCVLAVLTTNANQAIGVIVFNLDRERAGLSLPVSVRYLRAF